MQASLDALIAHLDCSVLRDLQATQTGDLASNNLKDKRRTINTSLVSETRERSALLLYLIFPSIEHVQRRRTGLRLASYVGDAGIKTSG